MIRILVAMQREADALGVPCELIGIGAENLPETSPEDILVNVGYCGGYRIPVGTVVEPLFAGDAETEEVEDLQKRGVWVYACDMDGTDYRAQDMKGPAALVIGNEGSGISRLVREKCDFVVSIPMVGKINSLNASNAAAILMYEIRRQRDGR